MKIIMGEEVKTMNPSTYNNPLWQPISKIFLNAVRELLHDIETIIAPDEDLPEDDIQAIAWAKYEELMEELDRLLG